MADRTGIAWTESTWNPLVGCSIVSPGCKNCYAMRDAQRVLIASRARGIESHYEGTVEIVNDRPVWTGQVNLSPEHILFQPLRWTRPRLIFTNSMSDLFHEKVPFDWIDQIFRIMAAANIVRGHVFQVLTKRAGRMRAYMRDLKGDGRWRRWTDPRVPRLSPGEITVGGPRLFPDGITFEDAFRSVWLGVSTEDQLRAEERIPILLDTPAAMRWISVEPQVDQINLMAIDGAHRLDWCVVGGESGPRARRFELAWARRMIVDCRELGIPIFIKQLGSAPVEVSGRLIVTSDFAGKIPAEWPPELRVREWPRGAPPALTAATEAKNVA